MRLNSPATQTPISFVATGNRSWRQHGMICIVGGSTGTAMVAWDAISGVWRRIP